MNKILQFFLVFLIVVLLNNRFTYKLFDSLVPYAYHNGVPKLFTSITLALISSLLIFLVYMSTTKESFFFEVSQPQPRCPCGFYGKNVKFEYTQPGNQDCREVQDME